MSELEKLPPEPPRPGDQSPRQWKLSTLFLLVTLVAVGASGYSRSGAAGLWITLFSFWFIVLGFSFICFGAPARTAENFFMLAAGFILLGAGLYVLITYPYW